MFSQHDHNALRKLYYEKLCAKRDLLESEADACEERAQKYQSEQDGLSSTSEKWQQLDEARFDEYKRRQKLIDELNPVYLALHNANKDSDTTQLEPKR